ncbi:MAG TPA: hypothetical protein VIL97_06490, partial [Thermoanaerobaculia bacterium]
MPGYRTIFALAGFYNLAFGVWGGLFPLHFFRLFDLAPPRYPAIWACLAMVVGIYGILYLYAARHLDLARPIIAVGLLGKMLGPAGFVLTDELPVRTFALIAFNDLLWWAPFALFLLEPGGIAASIRRRAPEICAIVHIIGALGAVVLLRPGSEAVPDAVARIAYIERHAIAWRAGWILWMFAAITLIGLFLWWGARVSVSAARAAFAIGVLGILCDFAGESLFIGWLPRDFESVSRIGALLTGGAANGLYTIAGIILTLATPLTGGLRALAWSTWASGIALTVATLLASNSGVVASAAILMTLFPILSFAVGRAI